jgi:hypothetical protein
MLNILQKRLRGTIEEHLIEEQGGSRKDRSTVQQVLTLRLITEENCFVDFRKAFDSVWHESFGQR